MAALFPERGNKIEQAKRLWVERRVATGSCRLINFTDQAICVESTKFVFEAGKLSCGNTYQRISLTGKSIDS